jgi:LuxR family maltose regulon positive regulatory protein
VLVDAPVGYGKSTLLAQWVAQEEGRRRFTWLSLEVADSDPVRLLAHLVESLRTHVPGFGATIEPALEVSGASPAEGVVPRLLDELAALPERVVIVLDDYHFLRGRKVHGLMERVVAGLPPTTQIALATRADPPLPLGRLRATGAMVELRAADLRFDVDEAGALLASSGIALERSDLTRLVEKSEGWPAGLYLAALSLRTEPDPSGFIHGFAGTHRHVADYLSEEVLRRQPQATLRFLLRTSILPRMCAGLCDAVLEAEGSQAMLEELERSNLFVVALDDERAWYRYHHLFGQMLRAELSRTDPTLSSTLHRRASDWYEAEGLHEEAVDHALASRDEPRAAELIARYWPRLFNEGTLETVRRWLDDLGSEAVAAYPPAALTAGWVAGLIGQPEEMERWLGLAELGAGSEPLPDGTASLESGVAMVRGLMGYAGLDARRAYLARALELEPAGSVWRPYLLWGLGHVALLSGDAAAAATLLADALRGAASQAVLSMIALSELAIAESELGRVDEGMLLARRAEAVAEQHGLRSDPRSSSVSLALGMALVAKGEVADGHGAMERALELRRASDRLSPWPTLEVLVALAPVRFVHGDVAGAKELLEEARAILAELDGAGDVPRRLAEVERLLQRSDRQVAFGETLTDREMAILRLMPTDLTLREIGGELFLSLNTVKTHSRAIYRKLGVSSRGQAIERARDLELL